MSFIGTVGVVAQQANQAAGPTDVSIAENASSGQNNAFKIYESAGIDDKFDRDYSDWTGATSESYGTQLEISVSAEFDDWEDVGYVNFLTYGYLRATGATSYSWSGSVYSHNFGSGSGDPTASVGGSSTNSQDSTGGLVGTGIIFTITPASGKGGGLNWPTSGNNVIFKLTGTATNSDGSTSADLYVKYSFTT